MKLTRSVSYAVAILLKVQKAPSGDSLTAAKIAKGAKFPPRFLYRVLRRLVDAGLLNGVSGPGGGYSLAKKPRQISLLDIVLAVEGDQEPALLESVARGQAKPIKVINELITKNDKRVRAEMKKLKLEKLANQK